jgi:hypothetical protein
MPPCLVDQHETKHEHQMPLHQHAEGLHGACQNQAPCVVQVVADKRVSRKDDKYAALDSTLGTLRFNSKQIQRFVEFQAQDALQYLSDEMSKSVDLAQKILCLQDGLPCADGLALLVASLAKAGSEVLSVAGVHTLSQNNVMCLVDRTPRAP